MHFAQILPTKILKYFPLLLAFLVIFLYFVFFYFIFILESEQNKSECIYVSIGTVSVLMLFWSLFRTSKCDPGYIPKHTMKEYNEEKPREYCLTCAIKRPERSHHCSKCKRCILNMDHHCIWTANCIGFNNRKYFILILFWGCIGMTQATLLGMNNIDKLWNQLFYIDTPILTKLRQGFSFFMIISQLFNGLGLYYFFWTNMKLVLQNISTLDEMVIEHQKKYKQKYPSDLTVYNLGIIYNFRFYFGNNVFLWFLPIGKPLGDGYNWDKRSLELQDNNQCSNFSKDTTLQIEEQIN